MNRGGTFVLCLGVLGGAAVAAAVDHAALEAYAGDGTVWLSWDNGTASGTNVTLPQWVGHDFDLSTLAHYTYVRRFRMYMRAWPNRRWDGGRIGIYSFGGGVPGSLLWGPKFVTPTREGWNDFAVGYYLGARRKFLPAWETFYNYPDGDTLCLDTGPARAHTWAYYGGQWQSFEGPNANLMLRVQVDDEHNPSVAPASLGRVKALYW
ncbi:MAG: hypothetical protein JSU81_00950 [Candidatus Coatesbacteria bacterium]|nr:MAG: hypothetical protein JSU81_00950 [Candidatus Coatesbacteria bacterium]